MLIKVNVCVCVRVCNQPHALVFSHFHATSWNSSRRNCVKQREEKKNLLPLNAMHTRWKESERERKKWSHRTFHHEIYYGSHVRVFDQYFKKKEQEFLSRKSKELTASNRNAFFSSFFFSERKMSFDIVIKWWFELFFEWMNEWKIPLKLTPKSKPKRETDLCGKTEQKRNRQELRFSSTDRLTVWLTD